MNTRSLRFRLTAWHAALLTAAYVLLGCLLFTQLKRSLETTLLDTQARRALQIAGTLVARSTPADEALIPAQIESLYAPGLSDRFIRITRGDGTLLYLSGLPADHDFDPRSVPALAPWPDSAGVRRQPVVGGDPLLIAAVRAAAPGRTLLVEVGTSSAPVRVLAERLLLLLGLGIPAVVLASVAGGYVLVRRALGPVDRMAAKAESISQHNLSERLPVARTGDEIERLALALNRMVTRLDEAFRTSRQFVADASHELRTPLTVLRAELETIAKAGVAGSTGAAGAAGTAADLPERMATLLEEVEHLSRIIEQLLALSRLDAGEAREGWIRLDLAALAAGTAGQMALLAEDRSIALTSEAGAEVLVRGDRSRLKQVVVNLLDNAIKYTPRDGTVRISVRAAGPDAVLEVADSGVGIPPEAVPRVFDRFFRADPSRSREPDGTGLGLAIVRAIARAHGGEVEVESTVGAGSRFRVRIPLAPTTL